MSRKPPKPWKPSEEDNPAPARPVGRGYSKPLGTAGLNVKVALNADGHAHAIRAAHPEVIRTKAVLNPQRRYTVAIVRSTASTAEAKRTSKTLHEIVSRSSPRRMPPVQVLDVPLKGAAGQFVTVLLVATDTLTTGLDEAIATLERSGRIVWSTSGVVAKNVKTVLQQIATNIARARPSAVRVTKSRRKRRSQED